MGSGPTFGYVSGSGETSVTAFAIVFGLVVLSHKVVERLGDAP